MNDSGEVFHLALGFGVLSSEFECLWAPRGPPSVLAHPHTPGRVPQTPQWQSERFLPPPRPGCPSPRGLGPSAPPSRARVLPATGVPLPFPCVSSSNPQTKGSCLQGACSRDRGQLRHPGSSPLRSSSSVYSHRYFSTVPLTADGHQADAEASAFNVARAVSSRNTAPTPAPLSCQRRRS